MQKMKRSLIVLSVLVILAFVMPAISNAGNLILIENTTSIEDGNFVLEDIPYGEYELYVTNHSYSGKDEEWKWYNGKEDVKIDGSNISDLDIVLDYDSTIDEKMINSYINGYEITGRTYSTGMGNEFNKSSNVVLLDSNTNSLVANTTSDENGNFVLEDIPYGEYELYVTNHSYSGKDEEWKWYNGKEDVKIDGSNISDLDIVLDYDSTIDEKRINSYINGYEITGRTYSTGMGNEFNKSSNVVLLDSNTNSLVANTTSDENGNFVLEDIPYGEYELYATNHSYSGKDEEWKWYNGKEDVKIDGSNISDLDIVLDYDSTIDEKMINSYINGYEITGRTYSTGMGNEFNKSSNVVLLKSLDTSVSPGPLVNISIVTGYSSYKPQLKDLANRINNNSDLNLSVSYHLPDTIDEDTDLNNEDIIYAKMFTDSASKIEDKVDSAIANGTIVVGDNTHLNENIPEKYSDEEVDIKDKLSDYWDYGATEESNFDNMIYYLAWKFMDRDDLDVNKPEGSDSSIYHPEFKTTNKSHFTSNTTEYFEWYKNREDGHTFDENVSTVGIMFYSSYYPERMKPFDALINKFESKGMNVITCYGSPDESVDHYFNNTTETKVDLVLSTTYRSQYFDIEELGVPVMNTVLNGYMSLDEWENTSTPLPNIRMMRMYRPETWGWVDPIMIASTETDSSGTEIYEPVDSQVEWIVDRAQAQTELSSKEESDKNVAIMYYNHGGGKNNIGASYLEVVPSINNLLKGMANESYDVKTSEIPNETELVNLFTKQGTNIGTWAPGELEDLVKTDKVELIPESTYMDWFNELPEERKQEVIDQWGEPPGDIMVYEDKSGDRYIVLPKIEISDNVILTPQPTRGWLQDSDESLYHDKELTPHHQYIAFYLWLQEEFDADVMVNMGRHGTVEWLPGKEFGMFSNEWPAIMAGDIPVVYPYVMDGMGEGMQAKRRGNAVMIDHLTPPTVRSGSYGNYSELNDKITQYHALDSDPEKQELRFEEIVNMTYELHLDERVDMELSEDEDTRDDFLEELDDVLRELRTTSMPYGLHVLGTSPEGNQLSEMINSMLGQEYIDKVYEYNESEDAPVKLLDLVINDGIDPVKAQEQVFGEGNTSDDVNDKLYTAVEYSDKLEESENEIQQVLKGMDGKYVESNIGGDPVTRPRALPSGRNFYPFDEQLIPTKNAWELGKEMANDTIEAYQEKHGENEYPEKVASVLWAGESTRHEGVMEAKILYLLGVKPVWDDSEDVEDVELIESSELDRPRIDVMMQISGLYRDTFPHKIELLDKAVYLAYHAPDNGYNNDDERPYPEYIEYDPENATYENYVRENTNEMFLELNESMKNETATMTISLLRVFGPPDGSYGTGMSNAVSASDTWENNSKLANLYMDRMSNAYGEQVWGESMSEIISQWQVENESIENSDVLESNLKDVESTVHSRSSNTYGVMDTDDMFQYLGGLNLAVKQASGDSPDSYIMNLQNPESERVEALSTYLSREITTRYLNPYWIEGMQQHGFEGAREMGEVLENLWGWEALNPDLVDDHVWDDFHNTYFSDSETGEWIKETNPYEYQSMTGRMLETARKGNWNPSDEVVNSLVKDYVETVAETGDVTCCHHTCGNPTLNEYVEGQMSVAGISPEKQETYKKLMDEATGSEKQSTSEEETSSTDSLNSVQREMVNSSNTATSNQTQNSDSETGAGTDIGQDPGEKQSKSSDNYVEGYEMEEQSKDSKSNSSPMSFSGADIVGTMIVLLAVGTIVVGYKRRS